MVLPGFQDGHVHLVAAGVELGECALFTMESASAIADSIRACAAARPDTPWLRGVGWELTAFPQANPSKRLLDGNRPRPAGDVRGRGRPLGVGEQQGTRPHGITRDTPDPADGRIERDPRTGEPSGTLREDAVDLVSRLLPAWTDAELAAGLARAQALANQAGITAAFEASASESYLRAYAVADRGGELTIRVTVAADGAPDSTGIAGLVRRVSDLARPVRHPRGSAPSAVKLFEDGVIE